MVALACDYGKGGDGSTTLPSPAAERLCSGAHGSPGWEERVDAWANPPARTLTHHRGPLLGSPARTPAHRTAPITRLRRARPPLIRPLRGTTPVVLPSAPTPSPPWRSSPSNPSPSPRW